LPTAVEPLRSFDEPEETRRILQTEEYRRKLWAGCNNLRGWNPTGRSPTPWSPLDDDRFSW